MPMDGILGREGEPNRVICYEMCNSDLSYGASAELPKSLCENIVSCGLTLFSSQSVFFNYLFTLFSVAERLRSLAGRLPKPEGTLLCSRNALSADFARIIKLIEDGRIDTIPWITHRTAFEDMIDVFPSYTKPETGVIKAVVAIGD